MKRVYEIMEIRHTGDEHCALASSYKKALDYVLANIGEAHGIKINDKWTYGEIPKQYKGETRLFGGYYSGYYFNGFLIKQHQVI